MYSYEIFMKMFYHFYISMKSNYTQCYWFFFRLQVCTLINIVTAIFIAYAYTCKLNCYKKKLQFIQK